jgi:hypothetical protein
MEIKGETLLDFLGLLVDPAQTLLNSTPQPVRESVLRLGPTRSKAPS